MSSTPPRPADGHQPALTLIRRLAADHLRGQRAGLVLTFAFMLVASAATAGQAWLMQPVLDRIFLDHDRTMLLLLPAALIGLGLVKGLASYGQDVMMLRIGQRVVADVQARLFAHLLRADMAMFVSRGTGPLMSHLTYDATMLRTAVSIGVTGLLKDGLTAICLAALMFYQDWRLAIFAVVAFPLAMVPLTWLSRKVRQLVREMQRGMGEISGRLEQTFHGIRQVKAYAQEAREAARTEAQLRAFVALQNRTTQIRSLATPLVEAATALGIALVVLYGGSQVMQGATTPGAFFSFIAALILAYQPIKSLSRMNAQLQEGLAGAERIYALLDREPSVRDRPGAPALRRGPGRVRFEGVRFAYGGGKPALDGIDLDIAAGSTMALVGRSGSGKSTVCNLLLRFWDADAGRILVDGQDVREVTLDSLRGAIALVSQDVNLFDDTVAANIAYGRPGASDAEIRAAARAAAAEPFIEALPDGYATRIGPHGVRLSGGERQRLSIARAMLKAAPILILDEATSSLDTASERQIQEALDRLMEGRTTLVVAHRLSTVLHADQIVVLDHGRVVESGTHRSLLARGGSYARLYRMQFADPPPSDRMVPSTV
ncbi:MAG: ABC transporter ATP-binding protein [Geminicoccaceae bacterium]